jgi:hypothetical protein
MDMAALRCVVLTAETEETKMIAWRPERPLSRHEWQL